MHFHRRSNSFSAGNAAKIIIKLISLISFRCIAIPLVFVQASYFGSIT
jgi:hypothetical protein